MVSEIGRIEALFRYPVKSMRGEALDVRRVVELVRELGDPRPSR
jgi:uncharacterized protein YcbX